MAVRTQTRTLRATDSGIEVGAQVRRVGDERRTVYTVTSIEGRTFEHVNFRGLVHTDGDIIVWLADSDGDTTWSQDHSVVPADAPWSSLDQLCVDAQRSTARRWLRPMITADVCLILADTSERFTVGAWCDVCRCYHEHQFTPAEVDEYREPITFNGVTYRGVNLAALVYNTLSNTPICNRPEV